MGFNQIEIGQSASMERVITETDIEAFAALTGDENPLHLDEQFAKATRFKARIAHGFLVASMISAILGNVLPGAGTIYLSQTLKFERPAYIGDTIRAQVQVAEKIPRNAIRLTTQCVNQHNQTVLSGEAVVLVDSK